MDGICSGLIRNYDINVLGVKKFRGFYIISTDTGKYSLKKTADSEPQLVFRLQLQNKLAGFGGFYMEKIYETKEQKLFAEAEGVNYILTDYIEGTEADFDKKAHLGSIISSLAFFHEHSNVNGEIIRPAAEDMRKVAKRYYTELNDMKKKIDLSKGLSEFDMLFLRNCDYYMENTKICEELLNEGNYEEKYEKAINGGYVCHNLLKRENLIVKGGEIWLASFSACRLDYYTTDLAMLIERYIKYSKTKAVSVMDIVNKYSKYRKVEQEDCAIILAAILLPESFLKIAKQYYLKKRSWVPTSIVAKMEEIVSTKATTLEYLRPLLEIVK